MLGVEVCNLPEGTTKEELEQEFSAVAGVEEIKLLGAKALIKLQDEDSVSSALMLDQKDFKGNNITVKKMSESEDLSQEYDVLEEQKEEPSEPPREESSESQQEANQPEEQKQEPSEPTPEESSVSQQEPIKPPQKEAPETREPPKKESSNPKLVLQGVSLPIRRKLEEDDPFAFVMKPFVSGLLTFGTMVFFTLSSLI